jgi:hypothetical protein
MAFIKLQFKPGLNRDQTNYSGEGGWWECDKIRFRSGFPEKIGGWAKATPTAFLGACRSMWNWTTSFSDNMLGLGTNEKFYIEVAGYFYDITPLRLTTPTITTPNTNNCVATVSGSTTVTCNLGTAHLAATGDYVTIAGVTGAVGGIADSVINANHQITVVDADTFTFVASAAASSTVTAGGGTGITLSFEITPGNAIATAGYGWGTGAWGREAWGLGSTQPVVLPQRDWWMDNFDNDLVFNIRNGASYWWVRGSTTDPSSALATRAITLQKYADDEGFDQNAVPAAVMQLMVSQNDKHLIAFGCVPYGSTSTADFDPMLIRWADQDTPGQWTPAVTNTAGFLRVSHGSRIVRAMPTRQEILVWTDTHLYTLQFLGTTDVFGLQEYADNVSIASPRASATAANVVYWMGQDKFYAYTGRVETLPCTLRNHVFSNFNFYQAAQVVCGTNEQWNEIWWFYPSATSDWNDSYVVFNHLEKIWYYGTMERTAWLDTPAREFPQAAGGDATSGYLYNHEDGIDDDGAAMESYIQSNDFDIEDGEQFMLTRRVIPDIGFNGSTATTPELTLEIRPRSFPGSGFGTDPADSQNVIETAVGQYTSQVFIRARARQMAIKIMSENAGVQWQLGTPRLEARLDGKR